MGDMPRLLRALSDHTRIKELQVKETNLNIPAREFVRPLLESMLSLLSGSASPALFPSLQILKITIGCYKEGGDDKSLADYISHHIKPIVPLSFKIKAVSPPNLKTIAVGESIV